MSKSRYNVIKINLLLYVACHNKIASSIITVIMSAKKKWKKIIFDAVKNFFVNIIFDKMGKEFFFKIIFCLSLDLSNIIEIYKYKSHLTYILNNIVFILVDIFFIFYYFNIAIFTN